MISPSSTIKAACASRATRTNARGIWPKTRGRRGGRAPADQTILEHALRLLTVVSLAAALAGCGAGKIEKQHKDFFTSGSREADQRASQRMAKEEQLAGSGEGAGEKNAKKASRGGGEGAPSGGTNKAAQATEKMALFDRLGGEGGISNIVTDFVPRAIQDP